MLETATSNTAILPVQEALSADARTYNELLHRWIEAKRYGETGASASSLNQAHRGQAPPCYGRLRWCAVEACGSNPAVAGSTWMMASERFEM